MLYMDWEYTVCIMMNLIQIIEDPSHRLDYLTGGTFYHICTDLILNFINHSVHTAYDNVQYNLYVVYQI